MGSALRAGLGGGRFQKVVDRRFHAREAGLGRGGGFLALFGGLLSETFLNPSPGQLARRQGEETRIDGPEVARRGPGITPGPVVQMGNFNLASHAAEDDVGAWHAHHRLPSMAAMPGCIGARKLLATVGRSRHSILYEYVSLESCEEKFIPHEEEVHVAESWTARILPQARPCAVLAGGRQADLAAGWVAQPRPIWVAKRGFEGGA